MVVDLRISPLTVWLMGKLYSQNMTHKVTPEQNIYLTIIDYLTKRSAVQLETHNNF